MLRENECVCKCEWRLVAYKFHFPAYLVFTATFSAWQLLDFTALPLPLFTFYVVMLPCCCFSTHFLLNALFHFNAHFKFFPFICTFFNCCKFFILLTYFVACLLTFICLFCFFAFFRFVCGRRFKYVCNLHQLLLWILLFFIVIAGHSSRRSLSVLYKDKWFASY